MRAAKSVAALRVRVDITLRCFDAGGMRHESMARECYALFFWLHYVGCALLR